MSPDGFSLGAEGLPLPPDRGAVDEEDQVREAFPELPGPVALRVERLVRRLGRLPPVEQRVVAFLASREPRAYTVGSSLRGWTAPKLSSAWSHPALRWNWA